MSVVPLLVYPAEFGTEFGHPLFLKGSGFFVKPRSPALWQFLAGFSSLSHQLGGTPGSISSSLLLLYLLTFLGDPIPFMPSPVHVC